MSASKIRSALVNAYVAGNFFSKQNTQWENVAFSPPKETPWAAVYIVPTQPAVATLGPNGTDRHDGFLQIDLNYPLNKGTKDVSDKADSVENTFTAGRRFAYSGQEVIISSCGRSQGRKVDGFYRVSVTAYWYAHVTRNS